MRYPVLAAVAAVLLVGCTPDRPKLPTLPEAFAALPLPPASEFLGRSGSEDALMFSFRSSWMADTVARYYNSLFAGDTNYQVRNKTLGASGEHAYYITYQQRPIWLRIRPEAGEEGSIVELTGAVIPPVDSTKVRPADIDTMPNGTSTAPRRPANGTSTAPRRSTPARTP
jgi:hypothetical protein